MSQSRFFQRGAGTLAVTLLLLFGMSAAALYVNRSLLFEQRVAADQVRSATAFEVAEAGLEWATGMLNSPNDIDTSCNPLASAVKSFRKLYVLTKFNDATNPSSAVIPATNVMPGCRIGSNGALTCSCPAVPNSGTAVAALGTSATPSFTVSFASVPGETESVQITSWGCTASSSVCTSGNASGADASAHVTAILKLKPTLRAAPASPITCGTSCTLGGSFNVINTDVSTNGILVNAGTTISSGNGVTMTSVPGLPTQNALVGNDSSLSALSSSDPTCNNSSMFNAYFGSTLAQYKADPSTKSISCSSAADCKNQIESAYDAGWRSFYFDTDFQLSGNSTLGTQNDPVTLVTPNALKINGNWDVYGLIFSNNADWNDLGTGTAHINGAQVSCAEYRNNGNGTVAYDADALQNLRRASGVYVRVPGSWRDFN
jgi:Tfp pilus assembly protein PilX